MADVTQPDVGGAIDGRGSRLVGLTALVTGAGGSGEILGCGQAIAQLFAAQGATVGVLDIEPERVKHTTDLIDAAGGRPFPLIADITDEAAVGTAVEALAREAAGIDIVVNNAAITGGAEPVLGTAVSAWERTVSVNVTGAMLVSRTAHPYLAMSPTASIVNISSVAANRGGGVGAYAASKGAIQSMTKDLAYAWGPSGIRINCIAPGYIHATMSGRMTETARLQREEGTLLGTEGGAWDIAWAALFLASPESRWLTGVILPVDGGASATTAVAMARRAT